MDDLANAWGRTLCLQKVKKGERWSSGGKGKSYGFKSDVLAATNGKFSVSKVVACGSDANLWAISEATAGHSNSCMIACGSYVSGDGGPLDTWSTTLFSPSQAVSEIATPAKANEWGKEKTVPLPYHIPCKSCAGSKMVEYENGCFQEIHVRCLQAKLAGRPYKALLLELVLAGNGAILSDRALIRLAHLATHHNFSIVVDEVMTGARTGPGLLRTQSTPVQFQEQVSHVTLGKWLGLGIVLRSHKFPAQEVVCNRGTTTVIEVDEAISALSTVLEHLVKIPQRHQFVLEKLNIEEEEAWGIGLIIFAPKSRRGTSSGLRNRFLPLLEETPIDRISFSNSISKYSKELCCTKIMESVHAWMQHSGQVGDPIQRGLCATLACGQLGNYFVPARLRDEIMERVGGLCSEEDYDAADVRAEIRASIRKATKLKLLHYCKKGYKRQRTLVTNQDECLLKEASQEAIK